MITEPSHVPEYLALLSAADADPFLTEALLKGDEVHAGIDLAKVVEPFPTQERRRSVEPIRSLIEDAKYAFDADRTKADAWLAPRLHATLRLTRREAADRRLWNHLALAVAPDYVAWRHLGKERINADRFRGAPDRQCFSRLWWAAELFRNGSDYESVEIACGNQDLIHTVLRMDLIDHRPTAQALVRLLRNGLVTTGREVNALCTAINTAEATLVYDVLAPDEPRDPAPLRDWIAAAESTPPVDRHRLPDGPDEEPVPEDSVEVLVKHFTELFETAPVRGRKTED